MYRILVFFSLLFLHNFAFAQDLRLSGKVVDDKNQPLAGVSVRVAGGTGVSTDVEGRFSLKLKSGKKHELELSAIGYSTKQINDIEVGQGLDNELNIVMQVASQNLEGVTVRATTRRQMLAAAVAFVERHNPAD